MDENSNSAYWSHDESEYRYQTMRSEELNNLDAYKSEHGTEVLLFYTSILMATSGYLFFFGKSAPGGIPFM